MAVAEPRDFDPFSRSFIVNPYPMLATMRREAAVHHVRQPNHIERYIVVRHGEGRGVLTDPVFLANPKHGREALQRAGYLKPGQKQGLAEASLLTTDPPAHTRMRRLLAASFETGGMTRLRPVIDRNIEELLGAIRAEAASKVDLVSQFAHPLTIRTLCEILGVEDDASANFTGWISDLLTPPHQPGATAIRSAADQAIRGYLATLIKTKAAGPAADDIAARLVARRREDPSRVSDAELTNMLYELILAGYLTTAGLIVNATLALLDNPSQLKLFRSTPAIRPAGVDELLRFDGPAFCSSLRFATRDTVVADTPIPAGSLVSVMFAAANRDERAFAAPDQLDLTRKNSSAHLGFSRGIHLCWGAPIARLEAMLAIGALVDQFPYVRLAGDRADVTWSTVGNSRSPMTLYVVMTA
jgi:cytochrome P450